MDPSEHLEHLRRDAVALRTAAGDADPQTRIAACPDWNVVDLVWHIGEVHAFWGAVVADRVEDPKAVPDPVRPATDDEVFAFAEAAAERLVATLAATDPATPVWTWSAQKDVAFVARRMAQETAVHRVDAERAAGRDVRIDAELASDGIDEHLFLFLPDVVEGAAPLDGSVHLHCTDVAGEWLVKVDAAGEYVVTREHAKGDAAMRGAAHDLLMVLWRRAPVGSVDIIGDADVATRLLARTNLE